MPVARGSLAVGCCGAQRAVRASRRRWQVAHVQAVLQVRPEVDCDGRSGIWDFWVLTGGTEVVRVLYGSPGQGGGCSGLVEVPRT